MLLGDLGQTVYAQTPATRVGIESTCSLTPALARGHSDATLCMGPCGTYFPEDMPYRRYEREIDTRHLGLALERARGPFRDLYVSRGLIILRRQSRAGYLALLTQSFGYVLFDGWIRMARLKEIVPWISEVFALTAAETVERYDSLMEQFVAPHAQPAQVAN